ncbi:antifreeze protein [Brucella cytisi]|uniref:Antifreeze protein n=1 Tax=Brucella cytisi TaxID=407152 RepID=A0A1J6IFG8_9HYPH|nr:antifreeze protein [Brucella cytisi]
MSIRTITAMAGTAIIMSAAAFAFSSPANALTMKECSAKYQSAKDAGTLGDMKWNDFRKAQCGDGADAAAAPAAPAKKAAKSAAAPAADDSAKGLTMKECSAKYQAAKDAGTLGNMKWNDFRKAQCGANAATAPASASPAKKTAKSAAADDSAKGLTMKQCSAKYQAAKDAGSDNVAKWNDFRKAECGPGADPVAFSTDGNSEPAAPTVAAPRGVKFPTAVSAKFSNESAGKARMHTCLEQYYMLKDANALGGLKWIQKGGGYYSLCNARLKGNS